MGTRKENLYLLKKSPNYDCLHTTQNIFFLQVIVVVVLVYIKKNQRISSSKLARNIFRAFGFLKLSGNWELVFLSQNVKKIVHCKDCVIAAYRLFSKLSKVLFGNELSYTISLQLYFSMF